MNNYIEQAIEKAIEGGYKPKYDFNTEIPSQIVFTDESSICLTGEGGKVLGVYEKEKIFLDPDFWIALIGKEKVCRKCGMDLGWKRLKEGENNYCDYCRKPSGESTHIEEWLYYQHRFIDKLAGGGTAEDFFKDILK